VISNIGEEVPEFGIADGDPGQVDPHRAQPTEHLLRLRLHPRECGVDDPPVDVGGESVLLRRRHEQARGNNLAGLGIDKPQQHFEVQRVIAATEGADRLGVQRQMVLLDRLGKLRGPLHLLLLGLYFHVGGDEAIGVAVPGRLGGEAR
jgi:hypothetical protein